MANEGEIPIDPKLLEVLAEIRERVDSEDSSPILQVMRCHREWSPQEVAGFLPQLTFQLESARSATNGFRLGNHLWNLREYGLSPTQIGRIVPSLGAAVSRIISEYLERLAECRPQQGESNE